MAPPEVPYGFPHSLEPFLDSSGGGEGKKSGRVKWSVILVYRVDGPVVVVVDVAVPREATS